MAVSVELDSDTERRLEALAARSGESKSDLLRNILVKGIEDVEDYFSAAETLKRIENGEERVYSAAEVRRELGLEER